MESKIYTYQFDKSLSVNAIKETLLLAVIGAEGIHGATQLKLDNPIKFEKQGRLVTLDASTNIGKAIARIFTNLLQRQFPENNFQVSRTWRGNNNE